MLSEIVVEIDHDGCGKLLILDEATSHLDINNEILISQMLRQLGLPIINDYASGL